MREPVGLLLDSDDRSADATVKTSPEVSVVSAPGCFGDPRRGRALWSVPIMGRRGSTRRGAPRRGSPSPPLTVEALESWHPVGMAPITRLGRQLARNFWQGGSYCVIS